MTTDEFSSPVDPTDDGVPVELAGDGVQRGPVAPVERIHALDVLRGFAILGILVMNIQSFAMIASAYMNPTSYGDLSGANYVVWLLSHVLADQKFLTIFALLFGAGVVLMSERRDAVGQSSTSLHYRRMGVLAVFGLMHGYLVWYGDILFTYAVCGMLVYPLRNLRVRSLLPIGLAMIAVASLVSLANGLSMPYWPDEQREELLTDFWSPSTETIEEELTAIRGGWVGARMHRAETTFWIQTFGLLIWGLWRAGGLMVVGMALAKLGVLYGRVSRGVYLAMIGLGLAFGVPLILFGVARNEAHAWSGDYSFFIGGQFNYWGSLGVSAAWIGAVMLLVPVAAARPVVTALGAVGRMALTNYLLHSAVCTTIFYGHGWGLFGQVERVGQIAIVAAVWAFQLAASPLWLRYFAFGPAEWLWRSLSYGKRPPMRRSSVEET